MNLLPECEQVFIVKLITQTADDLCMGNCSLNHETKCLYYVQVYVYMYIVWYANLLNYGATNTSTVHVKAYKTILFGPHNVLTETCRAVY